MKLTEALKSVSFIRELMNQENAAEANRRITEDFFAVFSSAGQNGFDTFYAGQYREGCIQALQSYEGKNPHWHYEDLEAKMRSDDELLVTSKVIFSLNRTPFMHALCMEIYRREQDEWKLARQYMEKYKEDKDSPFQEIHDDYWQEWGRSMASGDSSKLENLMADGYYVTFFMRNEEKPVHFDRNEAIVGMRKSIAEAQQAEKRMENRVIRLKDDDHAAVFYEQILERNGNELARLFTIENWKRHDGKWRITREVQEHVG